MLIHIGYHKTGSSWLQQELFSPADHGFFPLSFAPQPGTPAAKLGSEKFIHVHPLCFDAAVLRDELMSKIDRAWAGCPVISNERLSGNPDSGGYDSKDIADRLHAVFPEAKIFIVIREQTSMIHACYLQYLRQGGACSLEDYMTRRDGRRPSFSLDHFLYHYLILYYQRLFGDRNVMVLPYELLATRPTEFIDRLARFAGVDIPDDLPFDRFYNRGSSKFVHTKTRLLNAFLCRDSVNGFSPLALGELRPAFLEFKRRINNYLIPRRLENMCERRQRARIARLTEGYFGESNRITSDLIGIDLSQFGYVSGNGTAKPCAA